MTTTGSYAGDLFVVVTILALLALMLAGLEAAANAYEWLRRRVPIAFIGALVLLSIVIDSAEDRARQAWARVRGVRS